MPKKKKKAAPKKKKEESPFFVGINDPIEIRRSLLESSKEVVQYLQRNERFKEIRKEKAEEIAKLKGLIGDMQKLVKKAKSELPKTKLRAASLKREEAEDRKEAGIQKRIATLKRHRSEDLEACRKGHKAVERVEKKRAEETTKEVKKTTTTTEESKVEIPIAPAPEPVKPKKLTDLEKLEAELGEIESKLTKIT